MNVSKAKLITSVGEVQDLAALSPDWLRALLKPLLRRSGVEQYSEVPTSLLIFDLNFGLCSVPPEPVACLLHSGHIQAYPVCWPVMHVFALETLCLNLEDVARQVAVEPADFESAFIMKVWSHVFSSCGLEIGNRVQEKQISKPNSCGQQCCTLFGVWPPLPPTCNKRASRK